jgi:GNAT superfamily N-acetyltransferase
MPWYTSSDAAEFLAATDRFLTSRPAESTMLLTITETLITRGSSPYGGGDPLFGWWQAGGQVGGAFLQTPPYPVLLGYPPAETPGTPGTPAGAPGAADEVLGSLARALASADRSLPGINIGYQAAALFAGEWRRQTGGVVTTGRRMRLYRLGDLTGPAGVPGRARIAGPADRALLLAWYESFGAEIGETSRDAAYFVDARTGSGELTIWEAGGAPVSMAGLTRPLAGVARVAPVYTPPELRRRGYAGALTAAVSRSALDAGARGVVLFTDLGNPTSNALYLRLGYRPVHDRVLLSFTS